jgi:hypothetical protein
MQYDLDSVGVDSAFGGIDNDASGTVSGDIQKFNTIARQASGRVVGAGINFDGTTGSFGSDGYYATASATGIYSHAIDSQDRVVFAYSNAGTVVVARLLADGSGLDMTFGGSGSITTSITSVISNDQIRIALDSNDDIYVAAVNGGGLGVQYDIRHYGEGGGLAVSNGIGTGLLGGITELSLARLLVDTQGKVTIIGADNDAVNDNYLIVKLNTDFSMDTAVFNGLGYLKFKVNSNKEVRQATTGLLHADGRVIVAGYEEYQVD